MTIGAYSTRPHSRSQSLPLARGKPYPAGVRSRIQIAVALAVMGACAPIIGDYELVEIEDIGTRTCSGDDDCDLFLTCAKPPGAPLGVCTAGCARCDDDTVCVNRRCLVPCELGSDCPSEFFQCLDLGAERACVPTGWPSGAGSCISADPSACGGLDCVVISTYDVDLEHTGVGLCVAECTAEICPAGSHCSSTGEGKLCLQSCAGTDGSCPPGLHCLVTELDPPACVPIEWVTAVGTAPCSSSCGLFDCAELEDEYDGVCAERCGAALSCSPGKLCISGPGLGPHCLVDCSADPLLCDPLYCQTLDDGSRVCVPQEWQE
jgi:hypothetical protein